MNNTSPNAGALFNHRASPGTGVLNLDGVFYALLSLSGDEAPDLIALHGIRTENEAEQALRTLLRRDRAVDLPLQGLPA